MKKSLSSFKTYFRQGIIYALYSIQLISFQFCLFIFIFIFWGEGYSMLPLVDSLKRTHCLHGNKRKEQFSCYPRWIVVIDVSNLRHGSYILTVYCVQGEDFHIYIYIDVKS